MTTKAEMALDLISRAKAKGTDKQFRESVQRQPSCITGHFSEYVDGDGRCIAAHVRRAGESGTGFKAPYACVALTREEHDYQHQHGEVACLKRFMLRTYAFEMNGMTASEWFDEERKRTLLEWIES